MIREIKNIPGVTDIRVFETDWIRERSGICLPKIGIFVHSAFSESEKIRIIQHEYGHFLDFNFGLNGDRKQILGSAFLGFYLGIGVPSLLNLIPLVNKIKSFEGDHKTFWTELRANQLAKAHFGVSIAPDFEHFFPIHSN